jgi:plasmid stabilization system protein ParE
MKIFYSKQAQEDMVDIYVYISQQNSERVAERVINAIVKTCELLGEYPEMGRRRPELDGFGLEARSI